MLNFALFRGERKLDVEIYGENYHRNWDGEFCRRDQIPSRRLSGLGCDILRFWVTRSATIWKDALTACKAWMHAGAR